MKLLSDLAYSIVVFTFLYGITMVSFAQIPEAQKKAIVDKVYKDARAACEAIAVKTPMKHPGDAVTVQCAAYRGCMAGKNYPSQACFR